MPPTKGGVTTFMLNLMASPLNREFDFVPFTTSRPPKKNVTDNWGYRSMLRGGLRRILLGALITAWHAAKFPFVVLGERIDLVQIQASDYQSFWEAAFYACLARLMRRPVLFRIGGAFDIFHGGASRTERTMIGAVLRLPHILIAQSAFARDYIRGTGFQGEILQLSNWSRDVVARMPQPRTNESPICLFIAGQEAQRKGIEEVIQAAGELRSSGCAVSFHLVAVAPGLQQRIAQSAVAGLFRLEGPADRDHLLGLMERCDIFLLPSHGEGFPNSLIEAMAAGMACIATPTGAVPEMAGGGGVVLIPIGDSRALAEAIGELAVSAERRRDLGERARRAVQERYVPSAVLPNLASAYRHLLAPVRSASSVRSA